MEISDIAQAISEFLDSISSIFAMRNVCKSWKMGIDATILNRSIIGKLKLTLPQYALGSIITGEGAPDVIYIKAKPGFGKVAISLACGGDVTIIYANKNKIKNYVCFYNELGLGDRITIINSKLKFNPVHPHPIILCDYLLSNTNTLDDYLKIWNYRKYRITEIIHSSPANTSFRPKSCRYNKRIRIVDKFPDEQWSAELYINVPRYQSFLLYPEAKWNINCVETSSAKFEKLGSIIASHKRIAVFCHSLSDLKIIKEKFKGVTFVSSLKGLDSSKVKKAVVSLQLHNAHTRDYLKSVDCIALLVSSMWTLNEIISYSTHISTKRKYFDLEVIATQSCYAKCEYAQIKSFRPWLSQMNRSFVDNNLSSAQIERLLLACSITTDFADKCILSCDKRFFTNTMQINEVKNWWKVNKGSTSALTEKTVADLFV